MYITKDKIANYIIKVNNEINFKKELAKNKKYFIDINSKEFWKEERKKYLTVRKERKYIFNEQAKKEFLNKNNLPQNTVILGMYIPTYMLNNGVDFGLDMLKYFLDKVDNCLVIFFTNLQDLKEKKQIHDKIKFTDLSDKHSKKAIDFILYMPLFARYQVKFFGIKPVWWFNPKQVDSYDSMEKFINTFHNTSERIKHQELICFDKIKRYIKKDGSYDIFKMIVFSFKNFNIDSSIINEIYSLKNCSKIEFHVGLMKLLSKDSKLLSAHKTRVFISMYLGNIKTLKKSKLNISNCKQIKDINVKNFLKILN